MLPSRTMYVPLEALRRRDVVNTAATVMMLPALGSMLNLVKVTLSSILQVVLMCAAGYYLARRGVLDKKTQTVRRPADAEIEQAQCVASYACPALFQGCLFAHARAADGARRRAIRLRAGGERLGALGLHHVVGAAPAQGPALLCRCVYVTRLIQAPSRRTPTRCPSRLSSRSSAPSRSCTGCTTEPTRTRRTT